MNKFLSLFLFSILISCQSTESENHKPLWGIYQIHWGSDTFCQNLEKQTQLLQSNPNYVLFFRDLHPNRGFPTNSMECIEKKGAIPVISLELTQWNSPLKTPLKSILAGEFDSFFTQWALDAKSHSKEVWLRFGFEMNGDWFPWGQKPEEFRQAWQYVHAIFQKIGATNIKWIFSPNILYQKQIHYRDYYPGSQYVDYTALDGYNFGDNHDQWHQWQSFSNVFQTSIKALEEFKKPMGIAEIGCAADARKAQWLKDFFVTIAEQPNIQFFIYFNYDKRSENEPNWTIDSDPQSLEIFRKFLTP